MKNHVLSILVLLAAAVTGAWAQTEELLTTITLGGEPWSIQPVYTESGRATLETSGTVETGMVVPEPEVYGWSNSSPLAIGSVTINPAEGYTITKVVFWDYNMDNGYYNALTDNASPFTCYMKGAQRSLNENMSSPNGYAIAKIEVYGYASTVAAPAASTYTVTLKEGTDDATSWQGKAGSGEYQALPLEGVAAGTALSVKYNGTKKVKSVKAVKKAMAPAEGKTLAEATVGMLVGSDGKTYAAADKNNLPEGVTAVALVCYVSDGHGLALALADESEKMIWNTAKSTCSGKTPAVTGCTWKLATKDEWNNMINAAGGFSALRDGFSSVGGTNMLSGSNDYYWSSTTTGSDCAWCCTFSTGNWYDDYVDNYTTDYVRACLAF